MPWTVVKFGQQMKWKLSHILGWRRTTYIQKLIETEAAPEKDWKKYDVQVMGREVFTTYKLASVKATRTYKLSDLDEQVYSSPFIWGIFAGGAKIPQKR